MDRTVGRFSIQNNDKNYSYNQPYVGFWAHTSSFSGNQTTIISKSTVHATDKLIAHFPTADDLSKCSLMKSFQVAGPYLKKLLGYITEGKMHSDTLETYAMKKGMESEWLTNNFTDVQVNTISKNPNYENFDLTLNFRCIELFKMFNQTVNSNERLKTKITNTMKSLKDIRDNLCHNREHLTKFKCHDKADTMKVCIGDLLQILHIWDKDMDIFTKKKKIDAAIDKIMNGVISEEDFTYMCLQEVLNSVVEPALNKVTQLVCSDKKRENFKEYLLRNGMKWQKYKKGFFNAEKVILESHSEQIRPDVTLHTKIIEICMEWHPLLKDDSHSKYELNCIIRKIKDIRNNISHNMLSMSPTECRIDAHHLGKCLEDLENFIQRRMVDTENMVVPVLDIHQIYIDKDCIMSVHNPSLPSFCCGN